MIQNPVIPLDYPDPDVIRVGETYYLASTTMHFFPGCEILQSKNLMDWTHCTYVYDVLEETDAHHLNDGATIYGQGMWAPSLRFYRGKFYLVFSANETKTTYLFTANECKGPWEKSIIEGFYHDPSLYFEEDRIFIIYGNSSIHLKELTNKIDGPKINGVHQIIVHEKNPMLGYEGAHFYKIGDYYYLFLIHSLRDKWKRVQSCFWSKSLTGPYVGKDILNDDLGYCNQGVAQGGVIQTPTNEWFMMLFQDRGAVGRIPILLPMHFDSEVPIIDVEKVQTNQPMKRINSLVGSDSFDEIVKETSTGLHPKWQFNHQPNPEGFQLDVSNRQFKRKTTRIDSEVTDAQNTLTQRLSYPSSQVSVAIDFSNINEGDFVGLAAFQSSYAWVGVTKQQEQFYLCMCRKAIADATNSFLPQAEIMAQVPIVGKTTIRVMLEANFENMKDEVRFFYLDQANEPQAVGPSHHIAFTLDHFTGYRVGLFYFSTKSPGGTSAFSEFRYE